jgi:plastocyanin
VTAGTTVRWTSHGRHVHTVTAEDVRWDSGDLGPGASYSYTFNQPGTYDYFCRYHSEKGMRGRVIVR